MFEFDIAGLDTYFLPNLAVGQPSNNMDLSDIEISLGIIIILSLGICIEKKPQQIRENIYMFIFYSRITVSEAHCCIINHRWFV